VKDLNIEKNWGLLFKKLILNQLGVSAEVLYSTSNHIAFTIRSNASVRASLPLAMFKLGVRISGLSIPEIRNIKVIEGNDAIYQDGITLWGEGKIIITIEYSCIL